MKKPNLNMKRASLLTSSLLCSALLIAVPLRKELNEGWQFKQARLSNWYPATVPGVVHTDLINNKIIEDPFFRLNERGMQWIDKEDWIYQTSFQLTPEIMERQNIDLVFKGLDTYADVYLNEKKILETNNMFREWKTDIKAELKPGENILKIYFHSPIKVDIPKWDALPYHYEASNDQSENGGVFDKKVSVFARKAGYHYGWDWGPRLVTSGIWRPVYIEAWDDARLSDVFIRQQEVSKNRASIVGEIEVQSDKEIDEATLTVTDAASGRVMAGKTVSLHKGSVQKKRPIGKMNPIRLRGKILHQRRQFHQLHNVADFAGNVADCTAFQLLKNLSPQGQFVCHTAFGREKSPVCEDDLVRLQELLTKQGFVDAFSIKPDGHPVKLRFVFHGHRPPFSACPAVPPNRQSGHPCSAFQQFSPAVPAQRQ